MNVFLLPASRVRTDGGCLFGNLPRPLWRRLVDVDRRNRVSLSCNILLVSSSRRNLLVDTGCGNPQWFPAAERRRRGLERAWLLAQSLNRLGLSFDDIDAVIFTHLHWDHAGGAFSAPGKFKSDMSVFPRAVHIVHRIEYSAAISQDPALYRAYPDHIRSALVDLQPGRLIVWSGREFSPFRGVRLKLAGGHTPGHSAVELSGRIRLLDAGGRLLASAAGLLFAGDNLPTRHHLHPAYNMGYDVLPLDVRRWRLARLPEAEHRREIVVFSHDPVCPAARIAKLEDSPARFRATDCLPPLRL